MDEMIALRKQLFDSLRSDENYTNVRFNEKTGALQATHRDHTFDQNKGHYEKKVQQLLYEHGNMVILESEKKAEGIKTPDGSLNGSVFDIKAVEGTGKNNIKHKLNEAVGQGCSHVVLYFPDASLYDTKFVTDSYAKYKGVLVKEGKMDKLQHIWIVVGNSIIYNK